MEIENLASFFPKLCAWNLSPRCFRGVFKKRKAIRKDDKMSDLIIISSMNYGEAKNIDELGKFLAQVGGPSSVLTS